MRISIATILLAGCTIPNLPHDIPCKAVPVNSSGHALISFKSNENTHIDRGEMSNDFHDGTYRYSDESFGQTLYLYDGLSLKARIVNPENVMIFNRD